MTFSLKFILQPQKKNQWNSGNKKPDSQVAVYYMQHCLPDKETLLSVS